MSDENVFVSALLNCVWPDGRINQTRAWREIRVLVKFVSSLLLILFLFFAISAAPVVWVHSYVVPIPIVMKIIAVFDINEEAWEANVFEGRAGNVRQEYETWRKEKDMSEQMAFFWQKSLWNSWLILVAFGLYVSFCFYRLVLKFFFELFRRYKKGVLLRQSIYASRGGNYSRD
ncbi:MAG: hypothetical protein WBG51_17045 [Syntrophobacteria bacterium]